MSCSSFCSACLQECLKPKKPVCGVCRSTLAPGVRAVELERQIESTETSCHGCRKNFFLSKIRAHVATCSKYQNYIMEGVKATTKDVSLQPRNVPNRYTFPCPYCPEKNFDQEGLVEHCKLFHSTDTKSVMSVEVSEADANLEWPSHPRAIWDEPLLSRHGFRFICITLSKSPLLGDADVLAAREPELGPAQGLNHVLLVLQLGVDGHDDFANVDSGYCARGLSQGTLCTCLEPRLRTA
ncbi:E3 ubiquitin-protein ligase-like protein, partial [Eschrichtius robustus]|nr:E3 ubiquitin-protein ligase-like protein [Eschrichtius robustus]